MRSRSIASRLKRGMVIVLVNVGLVAVLVFGLEAVGQVWYRLGHDRWLFEGPRPAVNSYIFRQHPYLVGTPIPNSRVDQWGSTVTINEAGTRWTGAPSPEQAKVRVACLGGSTTFGVWVSDEDTWPAQLQAMLGPDYAVMNYGVLGYSTAEHIIQMALIIPEIKPDIVVLYEGWNDIRNYHFPNPTPEYYDHGMSQYSNLGVDLKRGQTLGQQVGERSGLVRIARSIRRRLDAVLGTGTEEEPAPEGRTDADPYVDRLYQRNLFTLKQLAQAQGASVYLVPQILNKDAFDGGEGTRWWTPYIQDAAMDSLMTHFNALMPPVCADETCTVVDDVLDLTWSADDFADDGHFSKEGGQRFADVLARYIRNDPYAAH